MIVPRSGSIPVLSLFAGAGGLDYGFVQAGFAPVMAIDRDKAATATYNANFEGNVARCSDLAVLQASTLMSWLNDLPIKPKGIIGGPPCQGFSLGNLSPEVDDPRNLLPFRYCEIIAALNKSIGIDFFVFENVLGLRSPKHRARLGEIIARLERAGFNVTHGELDAQHFGVPQCRRRIFLVGINRLKYPDQTLGLPTGTDTVRSVRSAIGDLPEPVFNSRGLTPKDIPYHPNHWASAPCSKRFEDQDFNTVNTGRSFRRLDWDLPSWTVAYGNREIHIHPKGHRRLSVLEAMFLQSFPKKFVMTGNFCEQVQQVSNAVPPRVARAVASAIRKQLFEPTRH